MKCIECGDMFYQGEMDKNGRCWACAAHVANEARKVEEEEAFSTLSTNELVAAGYIDAATMDELFAPWGNEMAVAA